MPRMPRELNPNWNGGFYIDSYGYKKILMPENPRADSKGYISEHIAIAEKAYGGPLPSLAVVHHHSKTQLILSENQSYHLRLHKRMRAFKSCGHAHWFKCYYCKQYKDPVCFNKPYDICKPCKKLSRKKETCLPKNMSSTLI